ncbi:MAG: protoporphyrinogen oxidase HemJ [Pseudomonadota bacterium]|nr:protoporphyrinogen oxidase HemJ [Pseudomonadota bacterium]MEC9458825.1 protoporphyrinogen oxidase HemJ [Pseudomonadota bacterium]
MNMYSFFLAIHIIFVIAWMAGLLYLPRLFVYHSEDKVKHNQEISSTFKVMEDKLYRIIMNPSIALVWITGLILFYLNGYQLWLIIKFLFVILMTIFHIFLGQCLRNFSKDNNNYSSKFFRIINEVPALIMVIIVFLVVFKP